MAPIMPLRNASSNQADPLPAQLIYPEGSCIVPVFLVYGLDFLQLHILCRCMHQARAGCSLNLGLAWAPMGWQSRILPIPQTQQGAGQWHPSSGH